MVRGTRSSGGGGGRQQVFANREGARWRSSKLPSRRYRRIVCHMSPIHATFPFEAHGDTVSKGSPAVARLAILCCLLACRVCRFTSGKKRAHDHQRVVDDESSDWQLSKQQVHMIAENNNSGVRPAHGQESRHRAIERRRAWPRIAHRQPSIVRCKGRGGVEYERMRSACHGLGKVARTWMGRPWLCLHDSEAV